MNLEGIARLLSSKKKEGSSRQSIKFVHLRGKIYMFKKINAVNCLTAFVWLCLVFINPQRRKTLAAVVGAAIRQKLTNINAPPRC